MGKIVVYKFLFLMLLNSGSGFTQSNIDEQYQQGIQYFRQGKQQAATDAFSKVLELDDQHLPAYFARGMIRLFKKMPCNIKSRYDGETIVLTAHFQEPKREEH